MDPTAARCTLRSRTGTVPDPTRSAPRGTHVRGGREYPTSRSGAGEYPSRLVCHNTFIGIDVGIADGITDGCRELYDWIIERSGLPHVPRQYRPPLVGSTPL